MKYILCIFITLLWTTFPNSAWIIEKVWRRRNFFFCLVCLPSASVCNINLSSLCIKIIIILIFSKLQDYLSSLQRITGWKCITRTDGHFTRSWHDRGLVELVKELNKLKLKLKTLFPLNFDVWNLHGRPILKQIPTWRHSICDEIEFHFENFQKLSFLNGCCISYRSVKVSQEQI